MFRLISEMEYREPFTGFSPSEVGGMCRLLIDQLGQTRGKRQLEGFVFLSTYFPRAQRSVREKFRHEASIVGPTCFRTTRRRGEICRAEVSKKEKEKSREGGESITPPPPPPPTPPRFCVFFFVCFHVPLVYSDGGGEVG